MKQQAGPLGPDVAVTHILVVADPARSRDFWVNVLGAKLYREYGGTSVVLRFAGTWLLLVTGGGPTADKPGVVFAPPPDPEQVSHAMTVRHYGRGAPSSSPSHMTGAPRSAASCVIRMATWWSSARPSAAEGAGPDGSAGRVGLRGLGRPR